ncbi:MAG: hypothetical protein WC710_14970 [Gallionella sp.]
MPDKPEGDKSKTPEVQRREKLRIEEQIDDPEMPPCEAPYLLDYFFELGPVMAAGMGNGPVTHEEIQAWQRNTGIELNAWEARMLRQMSVAYLNESQNATAIDYPAPWDDAPYVKSTPYQKAMRMKKYMKDLSKL